MSELEPLATLATAVIADVNLRTPEILIELVKIKAQTTKVRSEVANKYFQVAAGFPKVAERNPAAT